MPVTLKLNAIMKERKISLNDLSEQVGITNVNLSHIKTGKIKAIRFSTLGKLCEILDCKPGDILDYVPDSSSCPGDIEEDDTIVLSESE